MLDITAHMIVKNEERWVKFAILSVIEQVKSLLIWDTGSSDKTVELIKSINSPKIHFKQMGEVDRKGSVNLRNQQIKVTTTSWFLLVDGDEIWPKKNLNQLIKTATLAKTNTLALVNKTRNSIGNIYHYLPESKGQYRIGPWSGHLNIRLIKNSPNLKVVGSYPQEAYQVNGISLQDQPENLEFINTWYLHTTHLKRSGFTHQLNVIDRLKKIKLFGPRIKLNKNEIPDVLKI